MDQKLQIVIEFLQKGDTAGAQKALDQITKSTTAATAATQQLTQAQAAQVQAAQAKPPVIHEEEEGHNPAAMRRHFGAVAGQLLGMPGLGMLTAAGGAMAGIGVAIAAAEKASSAFKAWTDSIDELAQHSRAFDLIEHSVDSVEHRTRALVLHNRELAASFADIERQVKTVSIAVQQYLELQQVQINYAQRLDDAETARELARIAFEQRFNPIERIRLTEAAEEAAMRRKMDRERDLQQAQIDAHVLNAQMAEEREKMFGDEAEALKKQLPALDQRAKRDEEGAKVIASGEDKKRAAREDEMKLLNEIRLGNFDEFTLARYSGHRALANQELNPSSEASDKLLQLTIPAGIGRRQDEAKAAAKDWAQKRYDELNEADKAGAASVQNAQAVAEQSASKASLLRKKIAIDEGEKLSQEAERQKAEMQAEQQRRVMELRDQTRPTETEERARGMQFQRDLQMQHEIRTDLPPANSGGASINGILMDIHDTLKRIEDLNGGVPV